MQNHLYRACLAQLQMLLAAKERTPMTPPLGPTRPMTP